MTTQKIRYVVGFSLYSIASVLVVMLQSTGIMTLQLGTASAVLILPLVIYSGFYFGFLGGAVMGLISGAVTDVYSSTLMYNTVALTVVGFVAGVIIERFFNRNFAAASVLNISASVLYFFLKWLMVYAFTDPVPMFVLTRFSLPSAIYTATSGILLFFLLNLILKNIPSMAQKH